MVSVSKKKRAGKSSGNAAVAVARAEKSATKSATKAAQRSGRAWRAKRGVTYDKVRKDTLDLRDKIYEPPLVELPPSIDNRGKVPEILDQGREGACTGYGLAAVVNFLTLNRSNAGPYGGSVSASMLYSLARRYDEWPGESYEGSSIRGAMKGWHHHGACSAEKWPKTRKERLVTPEIQLDALARPLGAYYRVRHMHLNHMHAALREVGILYASGATHAGWDEVDSKTGLIPFRDDVAGAHAFAIVGYDSEGFWIQNSWSDDWGCDGFAKITYEDWIENGYDCWVARLGVPTYSLAVEGDGASRRASEFGYVPNEAVVASEIQPYFVNLGNDGRLSDSGRYSSDEKGVREIFDVSLPAAQKERGVKALAIYAHGGLNDEKAAAARVASMLPYFLDNGIYPLHFMWETGFAESLNGIVQDAFRKKRFEGWRDDMKERFYDLLDEAIEIGARPLGKPLWSEMKENGELASSKKGGAALVAREIARAVEARGKLDLHLIGHSAGSIFLAHLIPVLESLGLAAKSLTLYAPACTTQLFKDTVLPRLSRSVSSSSVRGANVERLTIFNLSDKAERDDRVGPVYHKSLLYMVSEAFEPAKREAILGMDKFLSNDDALAAWFGAPPIRHHSTVIYSRGGANVALSSRSTSHGGFDNDEDTLNSTLRILRGSNTLVREFEPKRR